MPLGGTAQLTTEEVSFPTYNNKQHKALEKLLPKKKNECDYE